MKKRKSEIKPKFINPGHNQSSPETFIIRLHNTGKKATIVSINNIQSDTVFVKPNKGEGGIINENDHVLIVGNPKTSDAKKIASETNILIIIGYSFPTFNRLIDHSILKEMKKIEKVFVQSLDNEGVIQRLKAIAPHFKEPIPLSNVKEFYIPEELNLIIEKPRPKISIV
ncbi:MAG: hypothetical protein K2X86_18395 [Cytophagaceae bacterium]|nr:hypothetical protein [Cytophagaceae bacterium]